MNENLLAPPQVGMCQLYSNFVEAIAYRCCSSPRCINEMRWKREEGM